MNESNEMSVKLSHYPELGHLARLAAPTTEAPPKDAPTLETMRAVLSKHGWYIADVVTTKHVESSEWGPLLAEATPEYRACEQTHARGTTHYHALRPRRTNR